MRILLEDVQMVFPFIFVRRSWNTGTKKFEVDEKDGTFSASLYLNKVTQAEQIKKLKALEAEFYRNSTGKEKYGNANAAIKDGALLLDKDGIPVEGEKTENFIVDISWQRQSIQVVDAKRRGDDGKNLKITEEDNLIKPNCIVHAVVHLQMRKNKSGGDIIKPILTTVAYVGEGERKVIEIDTSGDEEMLPKYNEEGKKIASKQVDDITSVI